MYIVYRPNVCVQGSNMCAAIYRLVERGDHPRSVQMLYSDLVFMISDALCLVLRERISRLPEGKNSRVMPGSWHELADEIRKYKEQIRYVNDNLAVLVKQTAIGDLSEYRAALVDALKGLLRSARATKDVETQQDIMACLTAALEIIPDMTRVANTGIEAENNRQAKLSCSILPLPLVPLITIEDLSMTVNGKVNDNMEQDMAELMKMFDD